MKQALVLLAVSLLASAAPPVASLRSASDFQLSGATVNTAGVSSWPVMAGDKVASGVTPATLRFTDGTVVTLGPGSQAKIEQEKDKLTVRLVSGFMSFVTSPASSMRFFSGAAALQAQAGVTVSASIPGPANTGSANSKFTPSPDPTPLSRY
jgi:ferric-dicitrate binding protein FerR (iron transport regulator)